MSITSYGTYIKELRKKVSLTQQDLADKLHLTSQSISFYENDKVSIPLNLVGDFANILNVDLTSFLNLKKEKNNDSADFNKFNSAKFAEYLAFLRKDKKLTLNTLSKLIGISVKKLSYFETDKSSPSIEEFITLATFYNLSYEELYFLIDKEERKQEKEEENNIINEPQIIESKKDQVVVSNKKAIIAISVTLLILFLAATVIGVSVSTFYINKTEDEDETESIPPEIGDIEVRPSDFKYITFD